MLQSTVLQMACNSPKGPASLHVLSLGGARLQSGACKLVGTGAQNLLCYHPLGLFLGSWIPTRPWPVAQGLGPWPGPIYRQGVIPDFTLPDTLEKNFVRDLASNFSK